MKLVVGAGHEAEKLRPLDEPRLSDDLDNLLGQELDEKRLLHELESQVEALNEARMLAEESLALAVRVQESYVELFDFAPMAYFIIARDGLILSLNLRAEQLLGLARGRISGQSFLNRVTPEFQSIFSQFLENVFCDRACHCEISLVNGKQALWVSIEATADISGKTCFAAVLDITEQRRRLQDAELAAAIYQALPDAVVVTDSDNRIISVNAAFTRLTGYTEQEVVSQAAKLFKAGLEDEDFYRSMMNSLINTGFWSGEISYRCKNGNVCTEWLSISTVYDDHGEVKMRVGRLLELSGKHERSSCS